MKLINILFDFKTKTGGGNSFLSVLKDRLTEKKIYSPTVNQSDFILFNLSPLATRKDFFKILFIKFIKKKPLVFRIDGPVSLYRGKHLHYDLFFIKIVNKLGDGVIYQSIWSKNELINLGIDPKIKNTTIINGCNQNLFKYGKRVSKSKKKKIVISSWSSNFNKGFDIYSYLDKNIDLNFYEVFFIGNSPINFENISILPPMNHSDLALFYSNSDIYITASLNDPCSNSLIEAISSGLFCIVRNSGGHKEILNTNGLVFESEDDLLNILNKKLFFETKKRDDLNIQNVSKKYIDFINSVDYRPTNFSLIVLLVLNYINAFLLSRLKK